MADFLLDVRVDVNASYKNFQRDITELAGMLEPVHIKIDFDEASLKSMNGQISNLTKALNTKSYGKVFSSMASDINRLATSVSQAGTEFGELYKTLSEVSSSLKALSSAAPQEGSALSQMAKEGSAGIESLQQTLTELLSLVDSLNGKNFSIQNIFQYNQSSKSNARELLELYRAQAKELLLLVDETNNALATLNHQNSAAFSTALGQSGKFNDFWKFAEEYKGLGATLGGINSSTTASSLNKTIALLQTYYDVLAKIAATATTVGASVSLPDESRYRAATQQIEEYEARGKQVEKTFEDAAAAQAKLFGEGGTGAQNSSVEQQSSQIKTMCAEASESLDALRIKIEQTFDFGTVDLHTEKIFSTIEEIRSKLAEIGSGVAVGNIGEGEAASAGSSSSASSAEYATSLRNVSTAAVSASQSIGELTRRATAYKDGASAAASVTSTYKDTLSGTTVTIREVANEAGALDASLTTVTETYKTDAQITKDATLQKTNTLRLYNNALIQGEAALRNWSSAEHSMNTSSRAAYCELESSVNVMRRAKAEYDSGSGSLSDLEATVVSFRSTLQTTEQTLKANGNATKSFVERIGSLANKFQSWLTVSQGIMLAVQAIRQMVSASIELDSALTQLKIVTSATDAEMANFLEESVSLAQELGKSITDVVESIETFSRLGYNLSDASELAEYAAILSNVAGVETDEATTGLTSIIKGYDLDVSDAEHVADVLVEVGQKYAVSASEMIEAYEKSGAALNATGTSFEKSAGLIASANAAVQNASTVGTALKTVSARIRGSTSELEELGEDTSDLADGLSKYADELEQLTGFSILEPGTTNEFKDIYDIFEGIADTWDTLSDTAQARVAEILGGTRQLQVISSILNNWDDAAGAYADALDSAGTSAEANATYMESVSAHIEQFKAAGEILGYDAFNSDALKIFIDTGTALVNLLDVLVEHFGTLGTAAIPSFIAVLKSSVQSVGRPKTTGFKLKVPTYTPAATRNELAA